MKRCHENIQLLEPDQQHEQQQQQTAAEEQRCPLLPQTTPVWGDRNVSEQPAEEANNNIDHSIPSTSDSRISMCNTLHYSPNNSPSYESDLNENTIPMTNHPSVAALFPKICKLCPCTSMNRNEYFNHVITHCIATKSLHDKKNFLKEPFIDDKKAENPSNEPLNKGKKRSEDSKLKKCPIKHCDFKTKIKDTELKYKHLREHFLVREDCSGFVCPFCQFASIRKHHMRFHWLSDHEPDFKTYACDICPYTCLTQGMLDSHTKKHLAVRLFHCGTCAFKTNFRHLMKTHLINNQHIQGIVLNLDGTPNPSVNIDVYGNKRGPKRKLNVEQRKKLTETENMSSTSEITSPVSLISSTPVLSSSISTAPVFSTPVSSTATSNSLNSEMELTQSPAQMSPIQKSSIQMSLNPVPSPHSNSLNTTTSATCNRTNNDENLNDAYNILCQFVDKEIITSQMGAKDRGQIYRMLGNAQKFFSGGPGHIEHLVKATAVNGDFFGNAETIDGPSTSTTLNLESQPEPQVLNQPNEPLNLSMSAKSKTKDQPQFRESVANSSKKHKRNATKLEYSTTNENTNDNETQTQSTNEVHTEPSLPVADLPLVTNQFNLQKRNETNVTHNAKKSFICYYCHIMFADETMYAIHMSFHDTQNPLMCSICYHQSSNIVAFFLHLVQFEHFSNKR